MNPRERDVSSSRQTLGTEGAEEGEVSGESVEPLESPLVYAWLVGVG